MNLDLYFEAEYPNKRLFSQIKGHFHRIGTLCIERILYWERGLELYSGTLFPNLSRLIIDPAHKEVLDPMVFATLTMPNLKIYEGPLFKEGVETPWTAALTHCSFVSSSGLDDYDGVFSLPSCESLQIVFNDGDGGIGIKSYLPNLRHLKLELPDNHIHHLRYNEYVGFFFKKRLIPTRQLLSLKINLNSCIRVRYQDCIKTILSELPFDNLRSLQIHYTSKRLLDIPCSAKTMPALEHLEIYELNKRRTSNAYLSSALSLPSLKSIRFDNCDDLSEMELMKLAEKLNDPTQPHRIDRVQLNHCGLALSLLSRLERMMPREFRWCQSM